jgi:hypothetical protein
MQDILQLNFTTKIPTSVARIISPLSLDHVSKIIEKSLSTFADVLDNENPNSMNYFKFVMSSSCNSANLNVSSHRASIGCQEKTSENATVRKILTYKKAVFFSKTR